MLCEHENNKKKIPWKIGIDLTYVLHWQIQSSFGIGLGKDDIHEKSEAITDNRSSKMVIISHGIKLLRLANFWKNTVKTLFCWYDISSSIRCVSWFCIHDAVRFLVSRSFSYFFGEYVDQANWTMTRESVPLRIFHTTQKPHMHIFNWCHPFHLCSHYAVHTHFDDNNNLPLFIHSYRALENCFRCYCSKWMPIVKRFILLATIYYVFKRNLNCKLCARFIHSFFF